MGNACSSGAVNAPKRRGRKPLPPIQGRCLECGAEFTVSRRGNRKKKFCNESCACTHNMRLRFGVDWTRLKSKEPCLKCHDAMWMKSEMSAILVAEKLRYIRKRRKRIGFDWKKVSSLASRAFHAQQNTLVRDDEKMRRALDWAWHTEWNGVTSCHYADYWHEWYDRGVRRRALWKRRYKVDPAFTCKRMLRNQVARIKRRTTWSKRSNELLGCTYEEARRWIESQFKRGMGWHNTGEWEIDHIVPISSFDLTDERQVRCVNHYTNLRPLWAEENRSKRAKILEAHQLALL